MIARDSTAIPSKLVDLLWPAAEGGSRLRQASLVLLGTVLLTLSAKIQVPFYPVPMTLQTLVVLMLGIGLGPRLGLATVLLYLAEGAVGLPVFAGTPEKGIGLAYMVGPTGGYLVGFALAALVAGLAVERLRGLPGTVIGVVLGMVLIYGCGAAWLASIVGVQKAIAFGVTPFLLGDLVKAALAIALTEVGLSRLRRVG